MAKFTPEENEVYMAAFSATKAKTVKERMAAGDAAVEAFRLEQKKPKGAHVGLAGKMKSRAQSMMEALDEGVKDGTR
jgi:hypothetical protein